MRPQRALRTFIALATLIGCAPQPAFSQAKAAGETLRIVGLSQPVEVIRDRWGIPHIYAESLHDVYFAQGFVMTSDRLLQMDSSIRSGVGRDWRRC